MKLPWTPEEDAVLLKGVEDKLTDAKIAALLPNRDFRAVNVRRRYHFGILKNPKVEVGWTAEEENLLRKLYLDFTPWEQIQARFPKRTVGAIRIKAFFLDLRRDSRRALLVKRFGSEFATDPRTVPEIREALSEADKAAVLLHEMELRRHRASTLNEMEKALRRGESRVTVFRQAMLAGCTLEEVGQRVGLSRERIRQVVDGVANNRAAPRRLLTCVTCGAQFRGFASRRYCDEHRYNPRTLAVRSL